jgi:hypothetical protein
MCGRWPTTACRTLHLLILRRSSAVQNRESTLSTLKNRSTVDAMNGNYLRWSRRSPTSRDLRLVGLDGRSRCAPDAIRAVAENVWFRKSWTGAIDPLPSLANIRTGHSPRTLKTEKLPFAMRKPYLRLECQVPSLLRPLTTFYRASARGHDRPLGYVAR